MNSHPSRISSVSSIDIEPFDNYDSQANMPWFCFLCGPSPVQMVQPPTMLKRQKVALSKTTQNTNPSTVYVSTKFGDSLIKCTERNIKKNAAYKIQASKKSTLQNHLQTYTRGSLVDYPRQLVKNNRICSSQSLLNDSILFEPQVKSEIKFFNRNNPQNNVVQKSQSQPYISMIRNMPHVQSHILNSNLNIKNTENSRTTKSMTFFYSNPTVQQKIEERIARGMQKDKNCVVPIYSPQRNVTTIKCESKQTIQQFDNKQVSPNNPQSTISTQEDIPSPDFPKFRQTVSINEPKQVKSSVKDLFSRSSKTPKFLMKAKKVSSRSEKGQMKKSVDSQGLNQSYAQFGSKIKIGIRKVQSINSEESDDQDQYSQVLSHGQRSFLIPEINEVEEMSRMSSMSGFRNWEDDV